MNIIPGVNMDEGLRRFGNHSALYIRFLKRFPEDPSFPALMDALRDGRMHDAFLLAHTFKGLTAQLGITSLHAPASVLCDLLRSEDAAQLPAAQAQLNAMTPEYHEIIRLINTLP